MRQPAEGAEEAHDEAPIVPPLPALPEDSTGLQRNEEATGLEGEAAGRTEEVNLQAAVVAASEVASRSEEASREVESKSSRKDVDVELRAAGEEEEEDEEEPRLSSGIATADVAAAPHPEEVAAIRSREKDEDEAASCAQAGIEEAVAPRRADEGRESQTACAVACSPQPCCRCPVGSEEEGAQTLLEGILSPNTATSHDQRQQNFLEEGWSPVPGSSENDTDPRSLLLLEGWSPTIAGSEEGQEHEDLEETEGVPESEDCLLENILGACRVFTEMLVEEEAEGHAGEEDEEQEAEEEQDDGGADG